MRASPQRAGRGPRCTGVAAGPAATQAPFCGLLLRAASAAILSAFAFLAADGFSARANAAVEPAHESGSSVTGAFEGWFRNPDGTFGLLLGYYNRNRNQDLDAPIGPENRIELYGNQQPGGPDRGQPTHFLPGRGWGLFSIQVPANFGDNKLAWTITANGQTTVIPASLKPDYEISPFVEAAVGNTPPVLSFEENGTSARALGGLSWSARRRWELRSPLRCGLSDDAKFDDVVWGAAQKYDHSRDLEVDRVSRRGECRVFDGSARRRTERAWPRRRLQRQSVHDGYLQHTRRVRVARNGQRLFR